MNILVVGCGRAGANLVRILEQLGHEVSVLDADPAELERLELIRTQRTAGRTVTEDIARIEREKRRLAQAGIDAFWQALAQLGYDRAQALELLRQDLQQAKED